ncbi:MAG: alpha-hydroxy-acid oxidizing protein, partial [Thermoplasmata archaeon]|nr:alpha-hydroxy-acid oxidizing protein [Thermoplasmata archaeon]
MVMPRKAQHIDICLNKPVDSDYDYWQDITLVHNALPEIDMDEIDTSIELFGKTLEAPIIIAAITGGFEGAVEINRNLAIGAGKVGVGMGIGSQRAAIEEPEQSGTYDVVKGNGVPLMIGNVGAPQLIAQGNKPAFGMDECQAAMDMIDADILAIHLNFAQEIGQIEGDTKA